MRLTTILITTVPLLLCAASMRDAGAAWATFAIFALAWPAIFLVAGRLDIRSGPLTWLDLHTWSFIAATVMIARALAAEHASRSTTIGSTRDDQIADHGLIGAKREPNTEVAPHFVQNATRTL